MCGRNLISVLHSRADVRYLAGNSEVKPGAKKPCFHHARKMFQKPSVLASKMAQQVKAPAVKPDQLSSMSGAHVVKGES